jgi:hypothetical protein
MDDFYVGLAMRGLRQIFRYQIDNKENFVDSPEVVLKFENIKELIEKILQNAQKSFEFNRPYQTLSLLASLSSFNDNYFSYDTRDKQINDMIQKSFEK